MSKVIDMVERGPSKKKATLSKPAMYLRLAQSIDKSPGGLPNFPKRYYAATLDEGLRIILRDVGDGLVLVSNRDAVAEDLIEFAASIKDASWLLDWRSATQAADVWLHMAKPIPLPPAYRWADEPEHLLTFSRLPWTNQLCGPTPTWDKLLSRLSNADAFKAWLGSLFIEEANHQQYVWLHGIGGEGKGAIDRFLNKVLGRAYRSEEPPHAGDKFWTYFLIGSRLVTFADCNAKGFPATGKFKSLCANDAVRCEVKGGKAFTTRLGCRFIFYSNERPALSTEAADMRRVIYCEFERLAEGFRPEPTFEERLWAEGGDFLGKCINAYKLGNHEHGPISTETEDIQAWAATQEAHLEDIFSENFELTDNDFVTAKKMSEIVRGWCKDWKTRTAFYDYLAKVKNLKYKQARIEGKQCYVYQGLRYTPRSAYGN